MREFNFGILSSRFTEFAHVGNVDVLHPVAQIMLIHT